MKQKTNLIFVVLACAIFLAGCVESGKVTTKLITPAIGVNLPEKCNTPDGMIVGPSNKIYLNCLNSNNPKYPGILVRITEDDKLEDVITYPGHPVSGKTGLLGLGYGRDGNFYAADNQTFFGAKNDGQSRLLRVVMNGEKALRVEIVAIGFNQSNAVECRDDAVYVTETCIDNTVYPMISGVYRIEYSEMGDKPVKISDRHLVTTLKTYNKEWAVGANGMTFDDEGNMYVCNFGEKSVEKFVLDEKYNVVSRSVLAKGQGMESTDGMKYANGKLYIADFVGNALHEVDVKSGKVRTLAKNANNIGSEGGLLDKPSEPCVRGGKVYMANIDLEFGGNEYDPPHTISVIKMD